jgi:hypothetical protein
MANGKNYYVVPTKDGRGVKGQGNNKLTAPIVSGLFLLQSIKFPMKHW